MHLAAFVSGKIGVAWVFIDPLSLYQRPRSLLSFRNEYLCLLFHFFPLSGIILDGIYKNFKVMFPIYGFKVTIFRPFGKHVSSRSVVDNVHVSSYSVARRITYECGNCTDAIRRFILEIVNITILQTILVVNYFNCNMCGIFTWHYRNSVVFKIWRIFNLTDLWWMILPRLMASKPLLAYDNLRKEHYAISKTIALGLHFVLVWIRICKGVFQKRCTRNIYFFSFEKVRDKHTVCYTY